MRIHAILAVLAASLTMALANPAPAQEAGGGGMDGDEGRGDPAYLSLGAGWFDIAAQDDEAADLRLEYRHGRRFWLFKPWAGLELTSDGGLWVGGGPLIDIHLGRRLVLTGSTGVGAYEDGSGKNLGATVEFRSQAEIAWRFDDRSRLGLAFGHISNAGLGDSNPGTEVLTLYYHVPIASVSRVLGE